MVNKDWTLLVLALAEGAPLTSAHIQKALFLIQQQLPSEIADRPQYDFVPHLHGPYAPQVNIDAFDLLRERFVESARLAAGGTAYRATMAGSMRSLSMRCDVGHDVVEYAQHVVSWVLATSLEVVVREIGRQFPQYQTQDAYRHAA